LAETHILREMTGDKPRQPGNRIFGIKLGFYQFKSRSYIFKETCAGKHQRGVPPKSGYFTAVSSTSVKTAAHTCCLS